MVKVSRSCGENHLEACDVMLFLSWVFFLQNGYGVLKTLAIFEMTIIKP